MSRPIRSNPLPNAQSNPVSPSKRKSIDPRRFYTAFVVIPFLYLGIAYSPPWLFSVFVAITVLFALGEFLHLYLGRSDWGAARILASLGAVCILFLLHHNSLPYSLPFFQVGGLCLILLILCGFLINPQKMRLQMPNWMGYPFGVLYVALLFGHFILLRHLPDGIAMIFFVLIVTWLSDTGGFVFGLSFGRHPLAPVLSPKKTMEGLAGGILFSLIGAVVCQVWFFPAIPLWQSAILGVFLALCGTLGDLTESAIKRSVQVKDSGNLIPGHGGILDRIDSLLLSAPGFYYYALLTDLAS